MLDANTLRQFRRRLTNLGSRNRSLVLTGLPAAQFLDLHETDFLLNKPSFSLIADLIGGKTSVPVCEVLDARLERNNEVSRKLRRIDRTARFIEEERGTEDLYVGWPFVRGKFLDDTVVHGPLLFFPVRIEQRGKYWTLTRRGDETAFLNPTLLLAYSQFNQIKLPYEVVEKSADDFDRDPLTFRTQLYEWLRDGPLELNFNPDLFTDRLIDFDKQNAKSLAQLEHTGQLKLFSEAVLGIFPQAGSYLVPDYDALIERNEAEGEGSGWTIPVSPSASLFLPEKFIYAPLPMDASQEAALRAVKAGQSLVVQGPPGTGKSQLIANMMADAAAAGKRVLLVCQKRAALDVVHERLRQVGMASFVALVHDFQDDRRALFAQVAAQIDQIDAYRQENNGLNTVLLERDFDVESRRIDESVAELQTFKDALFTPGEFGLSAKELYLNSNPDEPIILLDDVYSQFHHDTVDSFVRRLNDFADYQQQLGADHPWAERVSFAQFTNADQSNVDQTVVRWQQTRTAANEQTTGWLGQPLPLADIVAWNESAWPLTALISLLDTPNTEALWPAVLHFRQKPAHPALAVAESRLAELDDAWTDALALPGPETTLLMADLRLFRELLTDALTARPSWARWQWWLLTNAGKAQLERVLTANNLTTSAVDLQVLARKVEKRIRLESLLFEVSPLLKSLPLPEEPGSLKLLQRARHIAERLPELPMLAVIPEIIWQTPKQFSDVATNLLTLSKTVDEQRVGSLPYLTEQQMEQIWADDAWATTLRQSLRRDFDSLRDADRLQTGFSEPETLVVERLKTTTPRNWTKTFRNALHLAWLNHMEQQQPSLRMVSSLKMVQTEAQLQESVQRKQALSREILLVKLREQTHRNLTVNRLNNVVTYRDLLHQTTKKRNVWPLRKLMDSFGDEVFKLVPCWLASPETVSAVFPLRPDLFDLVIFDEASQCFAEQGIPAISRGKQVVVTGDNQQLRPSDLYRIRLDEATPDEEIPITLDVESLLELAAQHLPQVSLTEHYRSRSLDLITFSNRHFYQNRLQLLPFFADVNKYEPAIRYLNVGGTWQQNTNPTEADAVRQLLSQIAAELPGRSVGIVTFNQPQQQLILDKLEEHTGLSVAHADEAQRVSAGQLTARAAFVKNIENVQGDECDVIIFSVGYAPDERGKLAMQFGSLNQQGGGNRLNVAVTRARERVYVVTSLWPDQLRVDEVANEGPRLLKAYLQYALDVSDGRFVPTPAPANQLPAQSFLKDRLSAQQPQWKPELPFADLTAKVGDQYQLLILTDDDAYYQQTPKQAHAYLPIALRARQWPFTRVWSREFWRQRSQKSPE